MAVYVDALVERGWKLGANSHLIADSIEELHAFAARLGLRRAWFQLRSSPHYDLTARRHAQALALGARELGRLEFVRKLRELRRAREESIA